MSSEFPTKSNRSCIAVSMVLAGEVEEEVDFTRHVGRIGTVIVEPDVVRHSNEHVLI